MIDYTSHACAAAQELFDTFPFDGDEDACHCSWCYVRAIDCASIIERHMRKVFLQEWRKMTRALRYTRCDGTPETLPTDRSRVFVAFGAQPNAFEHIAFCKRHGDGSFSWYMPSWRKEGKVGDFWAYVPELPEETQAILSGEPEPVFAG